MPDKPTYITIDGERRYFGNNPKPRGMKCGAGPMADSSLISESEWIEFDVRDQCPFDGTDQDGKGACNGFAAGESAMQARWYSGLEHYDLSCWWIYGNLCGGIDRGSSISEALSFLEETGTCRDDLVPYGVINPRRFSAEASKDAANFKIEIGARLTTFDSLMTATMRRRPFNFSLDGNNMGGVDAKGRIVARSGSGNHALSGGYGAKKIDGEWCGLGRNHWGAWGMDNAGWFWFRRANIQGQRSYDAYEVIAVADGPLDKNKVPVAP